jgi:hypothetical protein
MYLKKTIFFKCRQSFKYVGRLPASLAADAIASETAPIPPSG